MDKCFIDTIISETPIPSYNNKEEINKQNLDIIEKVYKKYIKYDINITNRSIVENKITNGYVYIDLDKHTPPCWICYIDTTKFYNLKIHLYGLFIKFKTNNIVLLKNNNRFYNVNISNKIIFRKLNKRENIKIKLLEF